MTHPLNKSMVIKTDAMGKKDQGFSKELKILLGNITNRVFLKGGSAEALAKGLKRLTNFQSCVTPNHPDEILIKDPIRKLTDKLFLAVQKETFDLSEVEMDQKLKKLRILSKIMRPVPFNTAAERNISFRVEKLISDTERALDGLKNRTKRKKQRPTA